MDDDVLFCDFVLYLTTQYFRTARMRNVIFTLYGDHKADFQRIWPNHDPKRTWPVESLILAANLGFTLLERRSRYRLTFLINETKVPFITGDQPVINRNTGADAELSLYYPISPTIAISYCPVHQTQDADLIIHNIITVEALNDQIFVKSDDQIYASEDSVLEGFRQRRK